MANLADGEQKVTISKDTTALCGTKHRVKANITGTNVGDQINIKYKLESTSGITTKYHTDDGYLHKIRITIKNGNKTVYQQDFTGDDSGKYISAPPFLINKAGKWKLYAKSIAAGDCAKPEGDIYFAYFRAKEPQQEEQEETEEKPINPDDLTPLLSVGLIGLAGLTVAKLLRGKRSKKAETFEAPMKGAQPPRKGNTADGIYLTGKHTKAIRNALKERFPDLKIRIKKGGSSVIIHEGHSIMKQDPIRKDIEKTIHEAIKDVERNDWGWTPEQGSEWVAVSIHGFPTGGNAYQTDFDAETFEAPKKPMYETVMEIIKQGLYEPNSEQYKMMKKWNPEYRRLHQFWTVYAYLQIQNEIPADVKQRKIINQMKWIRRNWKKIKHSGMLDDTDFARAFKRARKKYGVNYEQEGFPPIPTNWLMYEDKLFYYESKGLLDKQAIIASTAVYSIMDEQAKTAFANLEKNKKRGLLKQDKKIYFGAEAPKKFNVNELHSASVKKLKEILRSRSLSTSGTRQNYIDRIIENQ